MSASGVEIIEHLKEMRESQKSGVGVFDDLKAHRETIERVTDEAEGIIQRAESDSVTAADKQKLPGLIVDLEALLRAQLKYSGIIAQIDREDGSYDNAPRDLQLYRLIRELRGYNIDLNSWFGTRSVKKVRGYVHDVWNHWTSIRWNQFKDFTKNAAYNTAMWGGLAGLGLAGGYALYHGGIGAGLGVLGKHLGAAGGKISGWFE